MKNITTIASAFLLGVGVLTIGLLMAYPLMWLWNTCLVPAIDPINPIGFWQAWGIYLVTQWLFTKSVSINKKD